MNPQETPMTNPQSVDEGKVDVLAVMDAQIRVANGLAFGRPSEALDDLKKARAAVAELIDAANDEIRRSSVTSMPRRYEIAKELGLTIIDLDAWMIRTRKRFASALARIGATP